MFYSHEGTCGLPDLHEHYLSASILTRFYSPYIASIRRGNHLVRLDDQSPSLDSLVSYSLHRLVATLGARSTLKKVNKKAILEVNVPKACETIISPGAPMALRLQSNLLYVHTFRTKGYI